MLRNLLIKSMILILAVLSFGAAILSCNTDPNKDKTPYSPESGEYQVMLKAGWNAVRISENIDTLAVQNSETNVMVVIECYKKTNLADVNITDIDGFVKFYQLFEYVKEMYENEKNTVENMVEITAKDMKNTKITAGKRQIIHFASDENLTEPDFISEFIYLETADHYFLVSFGMQNATYTDDVKNAVNEVIFNIQPAQPE